MEPPMADTQSKKKGRQKIPMRRIEREEDRLRTFSKRRIGIYKKATEISTLCATEVGVMMFSPAGKPFSYGVPNIETIANRLMNREKEDGVGDLSEGVVEAFRRVKMEDLNRSYDELTVELQRVKHEGAMLMEEVKNKVKESGEAAGKWWWDVPVADLNAAEMEQMIVTMNEMKKSTGFRLHDLMVAGSGSSSSNPIPVNEMAIVPVDHDSVPRDFNYGDGGC